MARAPLVHDPDFTLYVGDVREVLADLEPGSVDCCVTSPPYWGLRDYGTGSWEGGDPDCEHRVGGQVEDTKAPGAITTGQRPGVDASRCRICGAIRIDLQIGLERTPQEYVESFVEVFREVRRVLADHGTLWLNLGDSYAQDTKWGGRSGNKNELEQGYPRPTERGRSGVKPKDLVGIPWRVAFALQDDGWHLRSDVIWAKPNPMPESVTDRPTKAHEYVFMLTKRARYYFDQEASREPFVSTSPSGNGFVRDHRLSFGSTGSDERWYPPAEESMQESLETDDPRRRLPGLTGGAYAPPGQEPHSNARQPTLDPSLPPEAPRGPDGRRQTTIRGATPGEAGHENHAAREGAERWPNEGRNLRTVWEIATQPYAGAHFATFPRELPRRCIRASCPEGGVVLDPFLGAGTTALVAREQGRRCVGIELNPEYAQLAATRLQQLSLLA